MVEPSSLDYLKPWLLKRKCFPKVFTEVLLAVEVFTIREYFTGCQSSLIMVFLYLIAIIAAKGLRRLLSP